MGEPDRRRHIISLSDSNIIANPHIEGQRSYGTTVAGILGRVRSSKVPPKKGQTDQESCFYTESGVQVIHAVSIKKA